MKSRFAGLSLGLMTVCLLVCGAVAIYQISAGKPSHLSKKTTTSKQTASTNWREAWGKLPLRFESNEGQTDPQVKFLSRGTGYSFFLTPTEAVLSVPKRTATAENSPARKHHRAVPADVVRMKIEGGNAQPEIIGVDEIATKSNYLRGNQATIAAVANFSKVKYRDVYPGIDLVWYGNQQQLEYDWIVAPGNDPTKIGLSFSGVDKLSIAADGDLILHTSDGEMRQHKPLIYQEENEERQIIKGRYVIKNANEIGFEIDNYDTTKPLIIDPVLYYSTYLGGTATYLGGTTYVSEEDIAMSIDSSGNMYLAGYTGSTTFPVANAGQPNFAGFGVDGYGDGFIAKLNADASALVFSTYFGGSGDDLIYDLALGNDGSIYITGETSSTNFPLKNPLQSTFVGGLSDYYHAFISKLTPDGSALVYSTYLGGSNYEDGGNSIAVDADGNAYILGFTNSTNFPRVNALQANYNGGTFDAFVAKINSTGSALLFSTFYGGNSFDEGIAIAVDDTGIYLNGISRSTNLPTQNAFQSVYGGTGADGYGDGFVAKLSLDGSAVIFATYLGGSNDEEIYSMAIGSDHSVYLAGDTSSSNFPLKNPLQSTFSTALTDSYHAFITKLAPNGSALTYSTFLGGSGDTDVAIGIALDPIGCAYVIGQTNSTDFPVNNAYQTAYKGGGADAFLAKINPAGSALLFSTYLGGTGTDLGSDLRVDAIGNIYLAGLTDSTDFPTRNPLQASNRGSANLFLAKFGADEVSVGGANFSGTTIVGKGIVSAFGPALANATAPAPSIPLPTTLAGTTVKVTDSTGTERIAPLFFVSPGQVNYQVPDGTAVGPALVVITSGNGIVSTGVMQVSAVATTIFTLNQGGTGAAAALDAITFQPAPFNAKRTNGDPNIIAFYATGLGADVTDIDGDVSSSMQATIDGQPATILYAGRAPGYVGLNQINLLLTTNLSAGTHTVIFTRNNIASNAITIETK